MGYTEAVALVSRSGDGSECKVPSLPAALPAGEAG
jgi:hypothetical protein